MKINLTETEDTAPAVIRQKQVSSRYGVHNISKQQALANLGGNTALYNKYLCHFKTNYINSPNEISCMIKDGRIKDAHILVHSVKGLAGTLGLAKLFYTAAELEAALKNLLYAVNDGSLPTGAADSAQRTVMTCRSGDMYSTAADRSTQEPQYTSLLKRYNKYLQEI